MNKQKNYTSYAMIILAADEIEIKRKMPSEYKLKIADLYNIPIGNVKKLMPKFFGLLWELRTLLETWVKTKKNIAY